MRRAAAIIAFLAVLLAVDTQVGAGRQLVLGALTWAALWLALPPVSPARCARRHWSSSRSRRAARSSARSSGASTPTGSRTCRASCRRRTGSSTSPAPRSRRRRPARRERPRPLALVLVAGWGIGGRHGAAARPTSAARSGQCCSPSTSCAAARRTLRGRLPRRRLARALRHGDRHLDVGAGDPGTERPERQPAERRREPATSGSTSSRWRSRRACSSSCSGYADATYCSEALVGLCYSRLVEERELVEVDGLLAGAAAAGPAA